MDLITRRAEALRAAMPLAYELAIAAQQRDKTRYQRVRRRDLPPRVHRFTVGDYVYVAQRPINTLDVRTTRTIMRVREVRSTGVLLLEGADGATVQVRMEHCAPCHIPNLVTTDLGVAADLACQICGSASMADPMLLCDECDKGYHMHCLNPPLERIPAGEWFCPTCSDRQQRQAYPCSPSVSNRKLGCWGGMGGHPAYPKWTLHHDSCQGCQQFSAPRQGLRRLTTTP